MANAVEIANAYISLQTRMPGVKAEIAKSLGGSDVKAVVDRSGVQFGQGITSKINSVFKTSAVALGGVLAAGIGTALVKGFQRLDAIDTAQAKLRGLGHDATTISAIMQNALASVKGTAFGLGDAATVAAQAVAAGVRPGKDLEGILKTVANSAAAAGTGLGEMGSIFSKAMTQANGVQNDVIGQLADKGIPIYQELAKVLGVTAGEVFNLASKGKINFDQFAQAAQAATGTVAAEMGTTWGGMWSNALAAAGRFGEKLLSGIFPQLKDGLGGLTGWLDQIAPAAESMGEKLGAFVADVVPKLIDGFKTAGTVVTGFFGWMKDNSQWLIPLAVSVGTLVGAIYTWVSVTNALRAAQLALNIVMAANPIMLVVTAVGALVAGLVYFFTQTELGKKVWGEFTRFLGEAWTNIQGFFVAAWENVIQPVFQKIGEIAVWLYETVLKPVFDGISAVVQFFAAGFKLQFDLIVNAFRFVGALAQWLWRNALEPAFKAIGAVASWLWANAFKPALDGIGMAFKWLWSVAVQPVINFIQNALRGLGIVFDWLNKNVVQPVWKSIEGVLRAGWTWIDANVFTPFKKGIDLVAKGFEVAKSSISKTWDGIKKAAAVPINFVLDTVWNKGLRSFWNDMVTELGLKDMKLAKAPLVKFATGGVLPGYTPGRDVHEFYSPTGGRLALSGGEAIMRPEFTRLVGGKAGVDALNAAARGGRLAFKNGGVWGDLGDFAGDVWDNVRNFASVVGDFLSDPVRAIQKHVVEGIIRPLMGEQNLFGKTVGQLPINLVKQLAKSFNPPSRGSSGMGWRAMQDIVLKNIPGARISSAYRSPSGNASVGGAKGSYHMQGRAIDVVPPSMAMFNSIRRLFPNAAELIYTPAGGAQLKNGRPFAGWSDRVRKQHYNHIHLAMANGGVLPKLYDQGGWLPHGGIAVNQSGKPEPVLTNDQWKTLGQGGLRPGDRIVIEVEGTPLTGTVKRVLDGEFAGVSDMAMADEFGR